MMRVSHACLFQRVRFEQKEELEAYKQGLERKQVKYRIADTKQYPDGSIVIDIRRQYTSYDCGEYIDM